MSNQIISFIKINKDNDNKNDINKISIKTNEKRQNNNNNNLFKIKLIWAKKLSLNFIIIFLEYNFDERWNML